MKQLAGLSHGLSSARCTKIRPVIRMGPLHVFKPVFALPALYSMPVVFRADLVQTSVVDLPSSVSVDPRYLKASKSPSSLHL